MGVVSYAIMGLVGRVVLVGRFILGSRSRYCCIVMGAVSYVIMGKVSSMRFVGRVVMGRGSWCCCVVMGEGRGGGRSDGPSERGVI